jgi:hypothetical protein
MITKEQKLLVLEDWRSAFPELASFTQDRLYKIIGPIITGLELVRLPRSEEYRPHYVIYPLWESDIKECLEVPLILKEFSNRKGLQISIPFERHKAYFNEVVGYVKNQLQVSLEGDVSVKKLFREIDDYSISSELKFAPHSYFQAQLQELKIYSSLYLGEIELAKKIINQASSKKWDGKHFSAVGLDVNDWIAQLRSSVEDRKKLVDRIMNNRQDKKLQKLKAFELIH